MHDPYRLVLVSLITFIIVVCGVLFYQFVYPKKKISLFVLLTLLSLPPIVSIFRLGAYESGDFAIHTYRTIEFYRSLAEGNILPSWAAGLNATYGYPLFIFNYPLPYYFISFFHIFGFSFITSMKLFLAANFILSGIFMYLCTKQLFKNNVAAFTATIFYQFAPYHLIDLHFKVVIGEILVFTLAPLVFLFLQKLFDQKHIFWFSLTSISVSLLIMSHVVVAFFFLILFFCYAVMLTISTRTKDIIIITVLSFIAGSIASAYIWVTPFFLTKYTLFNSVPVSVYFPQIWELLFAPWQFGFLFQGHKGELSFLLGYTHVFIILVLSILLLRKKILMIYKSNITFWFIAFFIVIFLITPYSIFLWNLFPFLKITGPHRLLILASFILPLLAGYVILHILKKTRFIVILIAVTILSTILNWGQRTMIPKVNDQTFLHSIWSSTAHGEGHFYANSRWRTIKDPWFSKLPNTHLEVVKGSADIQELSRSSTKHTYIINAHSAVILKENTLYFPGWQVQNNNNSVISQPDQEGVITFTVPKGLQLVTVTYDDIMIYKILKTISSGAFIFLLFIFIVSWKRAYGR